MSILPNKVIYLQIGVSATLISLYFNVVFCTRASTQTPVHPLPHFFLSVYLSDYLSLSLSHSNCVSLCIYMYVDKFCVSSVVWYMATVFMAFSL